MSGAVLLNLAHLRAVDLVANTGSASRAAAAMYRGQSAVTRSIKDLETALGVPLFVRTSSGMAITTTGSAVHQRCKRVLAELHALSGWSATQQARRAVPNEIRAYLLNTRRLQIFISLARHRHMPTAAQEFGISQPAVSSAIRVLENGSGVPLFLRSSGGILLTTERLPIGARVNDMPAMWGRRPAILNQKSLSPQITKRPKSAR